MQDILMPLMISNRYFVPVRGQVFDSIKIHKDCIFKHFLVKVVSGGCSDDYWSHIEADHTHYGVRVIPTRSLTFIQASIYALMNNLIFNFVINFS